MKRKQSFLAVCISLLLIAALLPFGSFTTYADESEDSSALIVVETAEDESEVFEEEAADSEEDADDSDINEDNSDNSDAAVSEDESDDYEVVTDNEIIEESEDASDDSSLEEDKDDVIDEEASEEESEEEVLSEEALGKGSSEDTKQEEVLNEEPEEKTVSEKASGDDAEGDEKNDPSGDSKDGNTSSNEETKAKFTLKITLGDCKGLEIKDAKVSLKYKADKDDDKETTVEADKKPESPSGDNKEEEKKAEVSTFSDILEGVVYVVVLDKVDGYKAGEYTGSNTVYFKLDKDGKPVFCDKDGKEKDADDKDIKVASAEIKPEKEAEGDKEEEGPYTIVIGLHKSASVSHVDSKKAACLTGGNKEYWICSDCSEYFLDEDLTEAVERSETVIKATGHRWGAANITKEATCTSTGERVFTCGNDSSHTRRESIAMDAANHIDADGNDLLTKTEAKAATCTAKGNIEYWYCSGCKKYFKDEAGTEEIEQKDTVISALGHKVNKVAGKAATCTEAGYKEYYSCERCKVKFATDKAITKISDDAFKKSYIIPALGHEWDEGKVTKPATLTEKGVKTYTCKHDSTHTKTEEIPVLQPATYKFIVGANGKWTKSTTYSLEFALQRENDNAATFEHFTGIEIDGKAVNKENYTAVSGSVKISVKSGYLNTLSVGNHTFKALFDDGSASTTFTVQAAGTTTNTTTNRTTSTSTRTTTTSGTPATGDSSPIMLWIMMLIASAAVLGTITIKKIMTIR